MLIGQDAALVAAGWRGEVGVSMGSLPFDRDASPLAAAAAWMLERYVDGELTAAQASDPRWVYPIDHADRRRQAFLGFRRPISEVVGYEEVDGQIARIGVVDDRGRQMCVLVMQHPDYPGRVWQSAMLLDPPGVSVRPARAQDQSTLRTLELATPVQHDGFAVAYDRPDPFAQDRLRPGPTLRCVAEIDGHAVGAHTDALHVLDTTTGPIPIIYRQQSRVLPTAQGSGVMPAMNAFQAERIYRDGVDREVLAFLARGNDKVRTWTQGTAGDKKSSAPISVVRYAFDTRTLAGDSDTRSGSPTDEAHVCGLLNATHARSLFWPGDAREWFAARMMRSPGDYTWTDLVVSDDAVVGIWDAGWSVVVSSDETEARQRVATILDWGFDPDRPDSLIAILAAACRVAATRGIDALYAFAGPPAPGSTTFGDQCAAAEAFDLFAGDRLLRAANDGASNGIYVDPLYF